MYVCVLWIGEKTYNTAFTIWKILDVCSAPLFEEVSCWYWKEIRVSRVIPARGGRATVRAERIVGIGRE